MGSPLVVMAAVAVSQPAQNATGQPASAQVLIPAVWLIAGAILLAIVIPAAMLVFMRARHYRKQQYLAAEREYPPVNATVLGESETPASLGALSTEQRLAIGRIRAAGGSVSEKELSRTIKMPKAKAKRLVSSLVALGMLRKAKRGSATIFRLAV